MTEDTSAIFKGADFILVVTAFQKHFAGMLPVKRRRTLHSARSFRQFNRQTNRFDFSFFGMIHLGDHLTGLGLGMPMHFLDVQHRT